MDNRHVVQLYGTDEGPLQRNVLRFLRQGLDNGHGILVIATPDHNRRFSQALQAQGVNPDTPEYGGRILFLDAAQTLARFMIEERPDWDSFRAGVDSLVRSVSRGRQCAITAYGEMVNLLWKARAFSAAHCLEEFWNRYCDSLPFDLFCSYQLDVFSEEFQRAAVEGLLCTHSEFLPSGDVHLEAALQRSMTEILGDRTPTLGSRQTDSAAWRKMPAAEAAILWLRKNFPVDAPRILARARELCSA